MLCRLHCVGQYLEFRACCYTTILTLSRDSASEMHLHVEALYKCPVIIIMCVYMSWRNGAIGLSSGQFFAVFTERKRRGFNPQPGKICKHLISSEITRRGQNGSKLWAKIK